MQIATIEEAQDRLAELLQRARQGEEITIFAQGQPLARLMPPLLGAKVPILGRGIGKLIRYVEDEEHLKDFEEYMS